MALNGKLIKSKQIILEVLEDNSLTLTELQPHIVARWVGDALDLIGCPYALAASFAYIPIENYRGFLPCNLHTLNQVVGVIDGSTTCFPMRSNTSTFAPYTLNGMNNTYSISLEDPFSYDEAGNPIFDLQGHTDAAVGKNMINALPYTFNDATYTVNSDYIFTNFKDGAKVLIAYWAYPIDLEGYPLIPDNIKFKEAIKAFITMKVDYQNWRKDSSDRGKKALLERSETEWAWYVGAATTAGMMPTVDQMESWKNQLVRFVPQLNRHDKAFNELGNQEFFTGGQRITRY